MRIMNFHLTTAGLFLITLLVFTSCSSHKKARESRNLKSQTEKQTSKLSKADKEKQEQLKEKYAELLGISAAEIKNLNLYTLIDDWYGVPYKYGGNTKAGIDCSGIVSIILSDIYNKIPAGTCWNYYEMSEKINSAAMKEGDLLFFKIEQEKVSHIGLYLTNNKFVHATKKKGVMINDLDEPYYKKYFIGAGRLQN